MQNSISDPRSVPNWAENFSGQITLKEKKHILTNSESDEEEEGEIARGGTSILKNYQDHLIDDISSTCIPITVVVSSKHDRIGSNLFNLTV